MHLWVSQSGKRKSLMDSSTPSFFHWPLNKLPRDQNSKDELCYWITSFMLPESIIHRILKGSGELQHEQISLLCPYLITAPLEGKRDLEAVWRTGSAVSVYCSSWRFNVLHLDFLYFSSQGCSDKQEICAFTAYTGTGGFLSLTWEQGSVIWNEMSRKNNCSTKMDREKHEMCPGKSFTWHHPNRL